MSKQADMCDPFLPLLQTPKKDDPYHDVHMLLLVQIRDVLAQKELHRACLRLA